MMAIDRASWSFAILIRVDRQRRSGCRGWLQRLTESDMSQMKFQRLQRRQHLCMRLVNFSQHGPATDGRRRRQLPNDRPPLNWCISPSASIFLCYRLQQQLARLSIIKALQHRTGSGKRFQCGSCIVEILSINSNDRLMWNKNSIVDNQ